MLKLISLVLSFSLIFTSVAPSYAAGVAAQRQNEALRGQIEQAVYDAQEVQEESYGSQIKLIFEQVNELINPASVSNAGGTSRHYLSSGKAQTAGDVLNFCNVKLYNLREEYKKAGKTGNEYLEQGYVCTQKGYGENAMQICSNAAAFAQVCASVALDKRWDGTSALKAQDYSLVSYDVKKEKTVGKTLSGFAYRPTEQIFNVKVEGDDMALLTWLGDYWIINNEDKAINYLIQLLHIPHVCTKADDKNDMFEQRSSECELALKSVELLAGVAQIYSNYKNKVADEVFAFMKGKNREAMAAGPVLQGALALMALNTDKSYALLTQFLNKETKASFWQKIGEISVEGIVSASASIGSKREYYNNAYTLGFNYMDPVLLKSWYGKENFKSPLMQAFTGEDRVKMVYEGKDFSDDVGTYQFPYGNLFEDIGVLIAKDAQKNPRSARLAKTIFQDAIDARERKIDADTQSNHVLQYPTPLFAGVLLGGYGEQEGRKELKRLANTNFIDMNEGTQRRFRMNIDKALKTPAETQKIDNDEAAYAAFVAQYTQRDEAKYKDHTALVIAKRVGFGADLIIIAFFAARIVTGIVKWVGSLGSVLAKSVQGLRSFATKGFSKIGKNFNTVAKSSKRLAFRSKAGFSATAAGTASTGAATAAKAGTAVSTTQKGAATAQKVTQTAQSAAKTTQTTSAVTDASKVASAPANAGRTGMLTIDANGIPQIKPIKSMVVQSAGTAQNGLNFSRSMATAVGEGTTGASGAKTGLTYKQAASRLKTIQGEVKSFKGTPLESKFNNALNKYLSEARAAKRAAGGSSRLGVMDRLGAYEKALAETTAGVEYLETSALGATRVSPQVAATAFTMNNEITGMQKAAAAAGHTPRIYTDKDVLRVLPRAILGDISREIKTLGQSFFMTAKRPEGWGALAALTGVVPTTATGSAIEAARIFAETSRPAIVLIADTKHAGTLAPRMLSARKVPMMATKPIQMPISKLPVMRRAWMSFEDAYKVLTPVFMNMGLTKYDEIFSDEVMEKVAKANPEAYASFYTYDVTAERELFNARSSGNAIKYTVPTEIVAPAPANVTRVVSLETKQAVRAAFRIDVTNQAQVSNFSTRVMSKFTPSAIAAMDLTGGLATSLTKLANRKKYNQYKETIENYLSQTLEAAEQAKAADASLTAEMAVLSGVEKVLSQDTTLPEEIKVAFVDEVAQLLGNKKAVAQTSVSQESFEVENFEDLIVTDVNAEQAAAALPLQAKKGTLFRGMALSADGNSLKKIFAKGLLLEDVTANAGTLITSMAGGMGFGGMRAARQASRNINLTNSPQDAAKWGARFNDPSKRLIVVTQVDGLNSLDKSIVNHPYDIAPEKVSAIYALLNIDGKATWCLVESTESGKFKVTPMSVAEGEDKAEAMPQRKVVSLPENGNYALNAAEGTTRGEAWEEAVDDAVSVETKYTGTEAVVQDAINIAKEQYHALGVQNVSTYVSLLVPTIKEALIKANVELNTPETIQIVNKGLLTELGENHLLRQQAVDAITGRELTGLRKFWRWVATQVTGKMVNLDESDLLDLSNHVLKALVQDNVTINYEALRQAIQAGSTLVKKEQGSYQETDANGKVSNRSYDKETHDFSRILAQFTPAALQFTQHSDRFGFRPRLINTDVKGFPYLYTSIKLKLVNKDKEGHTLLRQNVYTVVLSDDDKLFKSLKENEILVVDTYGNLYKSTQLKDGKEKRTPIFDRKISVVKLADLNDMPVVVIQKTQNRMSALNSIYQAMGLSSTGRFLNSFLSDQYGIEGGALAGGNASGWATSISTGVYFTNIAPLLGLHQAVEKFGGKKVLNFFLSLSVLCSLGVAAINLFGGNPNGWITLAPVIAAIASSGLASAAIQQISNPTAQRMLNGKEAGDIVAGGQLQKTIGSLMTYGFASLAIILTGNWEFMYGLIAIPTLRALWAINVADLPLAIKKKETPKADVATDANSVEARNKEGKLSNSKFFLDPKILALFAGLMLFCGSETQASTATKSIITGLIKGNQWIQSFVNWLAEALSFMPWVSAEGMDVATATGLMNDSIGTLISGLATMLPVLIGRNLAKSLMSKYKGVAKYNEKMWLISGLGIAAALMSLYFIGPGAGLWLLPSVVLANGLLGNMFTFTFNMMKNHDKEKYNNAFSNLAGSLSTMAVVGCFLIPTFTNFIIPGKGLDIAFQQLIVPILGVAIALGINFKNFANPFDWKKPMNKTQLDQLQTSVIAQMALLAPEADLSELEEAAAQANPDLTQQEIHALVEKNVSRLKTELASAMGLSTEELVGLINGTLSKEIKEGAFLKLAEQLNVKFKSLAKEDALLENRIVNQLMLQINAGASRLAEEQHKEELEDLSEGEVNP